MSAHAQPNDVGVLADAALLDRRAAVRWPCRPDVLDNGPPGRGDTPFRPAIILDLSTDGAGLVLGRCPLEGALVELMLRNPAREFARRVLATVAHVTPAGDDAWLVGVAFLEKLSDDDLAALL